MTAPRNVAGDSATVGVQAETVHGGVTIYQVGPEDPPERRFEAGVAYLRAGVPSRARQLIWAAVVDGVKTGRSHFYLILALLSGRTLQSLSTEELATLRQARAWVSGQADDEWTRAVRIINRLIETISPDSTADLNVIVKEFDDLGRRQRDDMLRNLEVFLAGQHRDWSWQHAFATAAEERCARDRADRVWRFFQSDPARPRVPVVPPVRTTTGDRVRALLATAVFLAAGCLLAVESWGHFPWPTVGALAIVAGSGYLLARTGVRRAHLGRRRRVSDQRLARSSRPPAEGRHRFASGVDRDFRYYFGRYVPAGADRGQWLDETAGVQQTLRDEIVTIYREQRVEAKEVAWLVRYLVSDVKRQWQSGRLWSHRDQFRVPVTTTLLIGLSSVSLVAATPVLLWGAMLSNPFMAALGVIVAVASGRPAVRGLAESRLERLRYAAETAESEQEFTRRQAAYDRWAAKLASRPDDAEMAHWLDCDHKALIEEAMRHYNLAPHDVVAHAFIEAPTSHGYKRARVAKGPWRYSRYQLLIFLLTADGVRQFAADLDFETALFHDRERSNYRYDAVAAVHVKSADDGEQKLELTLLNNHAVRVTVTGPPTTAWVAGENDRSISDVTLDAAGLGNTLHVLEGIAAEGKHWIASERQREAAGLAKLVDAVDG